MNSVYGYEDPVMHIYVLAERSSFVLILLFC